MLLRNLFCWKFADVMRHFVPKYAVKNSLSFFLREICPEVGYTWIALSLSAEQNFL